MRVQERPHVRRHDGQEQRGHRPDRPGREGDPGELPPDLARDVRAPDGPAAGRRPGRLRDSNEREGGHDRDADPDDVARYEAVRSPLGHDAADDSPRGAPSGLRKPGHERGPSAGTLRLELDERSRGRPVDRPDREPLHRARSEQPRAAVRQREEDERVGGEDQREQGGREPEALAVHGVQRRREIGAEEHGAEHARDAEERSRRAP